MREQLQDLYSNFSGQDVFILGGGYSIKDINIEYLYDKKCICINGAYKLLPNPYALFWGDSSWTDEYLKNPHPVKLKFHATAYAKNFIDKDLRGPGDSTMLLKTGDYGYDPDIDHVMGNNSGTQCLNLVINTRPNRIYLLGFDMRDNPLKRGETHFHNNGLYVKAGIYSGQFIPSIVALEKEVRKKKIPIEIINCSKTSAIPCFKKEILPGLYK